MKTMRILVIKPSSLGDVIQMLQVIEGAYHAAKKEKIQLEIHWIIRDCFEDFLKQSPYVSQRFRFERHGGVLAFYRLMKQVRAYTYDVLIDGQGLLRSGLMTFFAKAKLKLGRKDAREGARLFYHKTFAPPPGRSHAVDILHALLHPLPLQSQPQVPLTLNLQPWHFPFPPGAILLFPNSRGPHKEWPYFYELTFELLKQTPHACVWIGQKAPPRIPQHPRFINFIGQTNLSDLPLLIQNARCIVANDSGPVHLAAALNRTVIGLYGPTDGQKYGPYPVAQHCVLQAPNGQLKNLSVYTALEALKKCLHEAS